MSTTHVDAGPDHDVPERPEDRGTILVMVLVMMVIGSLIILPVLVYTMSVFRAGTVQTDKTEAIELARGGTWVALSNQEDLFEKCNGLNELSLSLPPVDTKCYLVDDNPLRPAAEIPYHVATIQADKVIPPSIANADTISPNTNPTDWDKWLTDPGVSSDSAAGTIWVPDLPVRSTTTSNRDTLLDEDNNCRLFFPGTFRQPIHIFGQAYFASGVYYFEEPIYLHKGADVVAGYGPKAGCVADDFLAIAGAEDNPQPHNTNGWGATFVLGDNARILIDESDGTGSTIRFVMNQRYVPLDEPSILASTNVSIISVNGTHEPLLPAENLGDDLVIPNVINVPASNVDDGVTIEPAVGEGYVPSNLTNKPGPPDAPVITSVDRYRRDDDDWDGRFTVTWTAPNDNGSPITGYVVTADFPSVSDRTCSTIAPPTGGTVQTSCTIRDVGNGWTGDISVVATNDYGASDPSPEVTETVSYAVELLPPDAPLNPTVDRYADGVVVSWDPPASDGGGPIVEYRVKASNGTEPDAECVARWDETSCPLFFGFPLVADPQYNVEIVAVQYDARPGPAPTPWIESPPAILLNEVLNAIPGNGNIPGPPAPPTSAGRTPEPIVDLRSTAGTPTTVFVEGYILVPQGRIAVDAPNPVGSKVELLGGVVAGSIDLGTEPEVLDISLENPVSQKRVKIVSTVDTGRFEAESVAIVQINKSGSLAVNAWYVQ